MKSPSYLTDKRIPRTNCLPRIGKVVLVLKGDQGVRIKQAPCQNCLMDIFRVQKWPPSLHPFRRGMLDSGALNAHTPLFYSHLEFSSRTKLCLYFASEVPQKTSKSFPIMCDNSLPFTALFLRFDMKPTPSQSTRISYVAPRRIAPSRRLMMTALGGSDSASTSCDVAVGEPKKPRAKATMAA